MKKKTAIFLIIAAVLICAIGIGVFAAASMEKPSAVMSYMIGLTDEMPEYADANGDGKVDILDIILLMKDEQVEIIDSNGTDKLTINDMIELEAGTEYALTAISTAYSSEDLTWTTNDDSIATVSADGTVTGLNPGECTVTVTTAGGKSQSVKATVYETVAEKVTYRWDFNDLTDSVGGNDLTLAPLAQAEGAGENYSLTGGIYTVSTSAGSNERPYFTFKDPIEISNTHDWSIEFKGYVYSGGNVFFGQNPTDPEDSTEIDGFFYVSPNANWGTADSPSYRIKFRADGKNIYLELGENKDNFYSMATWKIDYAASSEVMTLMLSTDDGATWTTVSTVTTSTFSATLHSLFGSLSGVGKYNFNGEMDYVEINCYKYTRVDNKADFEVTYRWDFNDLTDSIGGNDLTLNPAAHENAATNYTIADGMYSLSTTSDELQRPDFVMDESFTLDNTSDWAIQWKGYMRGGSMVFGQNPADTTKTGDITEGGFFYISPYANWGTTEAPKYVIRFQPNGTKNILLPFTDYKPLMAAMNTWRIEYIAETNVITVYVSTDSGANWTVASETTAGTFTATVNNVFGRGQYDGKYNFNGEMDYLQVSFGKTDTTGGVRLDTLTLDDNNYSLSYNKAKIEYTVYLPDGRPSVPRVEATAADGLTVDIQQAYITDGQTGGTATVVVSDTSGNTTTYTVKFVKSARYGFVLQYDDRYTFTPDYTLKEGESFTFESSDSTVVSVDANGIMTAAKVSDTAVTVTAKAGDSVVDTLVIDRVERAHINLFFITGQSNGQGCYDTVSYDGTTETEGNEWMIPYLDQLAAVEKIGGEGRVYSYDVHPRAENINAGLPEAYTLYDMQNYAKQGHQAALGKTWYDLTGEKVVFLQSAWSGAPIESWMDPDRYEEAGGYGVATRNFYQTTKDGYEKLTAVVSANYEIILKANFWCQGETAMSSYYDKSISNYIFSSNAAYDASKLITDETYYEYFMRIDNDMREDFGLDFNGIMFTKTKGADTDTTIVPIVSAYFGLVNNNENIFTATRKFIEIATQYKTGDPTAEGYGFMGTDGVMGNHYNQIGYNYHGKEAANNLFGFVYKKLENATGVEIIDNDGKTRLNLESETIEIKAGEVYRLGALSLPHYTSENLTWSSSDNLIATVDKFGTVKGGAVGEAVITVTTESGKSQSVKFSVYETVAESVSYRWDFNDLTDSAGGNDLTLNSGTYTVADGIYTSKSDSSDLTRADFSFSTPVVLNSAADWSIQWKGYMQAGSTLLGQQPTDTSSTSEIAGHIYTSPYANWGTSASPKYAVKLKPEKGSQILLAYTENQSAMLAMNTWKIEYTAETNIMTLSLSTDDGATWTVTGEATAGVFETTYDSLFGRTRENGQYNFNGEMDYIEINCYKFTKVTKKNGVDVAYRWDFNDLTDNVGGNDLTLNTACPAAASTNYSFVDGVYTVSKSTADLARPDFVMEEAFTIDDTKNWEIQWKGIFYWAGTLFGQNPEDTSTQTEVANKGFFYIPPSASTNWGTSTNVINAMKFHPSGSSKYVLLPFTEYQPYMLEVNSWRISYDAEDRVITLSVSTDDGGSWIICSKTTMSSAYTATFQNLFGRSFDNGKYNFIGEMDYVQVSLVK